MSSEPRGRVRCRMAFRDRLRWISHLEFLRLLTRALRRSGLPIAYSQGYNPHVRLAFATARPVGMASEAEYVDIYFEERLTGSRVKNYVARVLPVGVEVRECRDIDMERPSLASRINACRYEFRFEGVSPEDIEAARSRMLQSGDLWITRHRRNKPDREINLRPGVLEVSSVYSVAPSGAGLLVDLALGGESGIRASEFSSVLLEFLESTPPRGVKITTRKVDVYRREDEKVLSPWNL
ncbi:MAG: TIGR03936 family radical SAM-associated protein [Bacillota bacterium]